MDENGDFTATDDELQRYMLLAKYNRDVILFIDLNNGRIIEANQAAVKVYGYSREDLLRLSIYDLRADPSRERPVKLNAEGVLFETLHRRKDGSTFPIEASSQTVRIGASSKVITIIRDATARKQTERELRESEEQYRLLFASNPTPMWVFDEETLQFLAVNDAAVEHYGWSRDEFLAMSVLDVRPPEEREAARSIILRPGTVLEEAIGVHRHWRKDGSVMDVEITVSSIRFGGRRGRLCALKDVTELRRAMAALQDARDLLSGIMESTSDFIAAIDTGYRYMALNSAYVAECRAVFGVDLKIGDSVFDLLDRLPEDRQAALDPVERALKGESVLPTVGFGPPGKRRFYEMRTSPIRSSDGRIFGVAQIGRNITERLKAEDELRVSEQKFALAFSTNPAAIAVTRFDDGVIIDVNDTWVALTGFSRAEAVGRSAWSLNIWTDEPAKQRFIRKLREERSLRNWEQEFRKKTGEVFFTQVSAQVLPGPGVEMFLTTFVDITERKLAERALQQANENLEGRIRERTQELSESLDALNRRTGQLQILASELTMAEQRERWRLAQVLHDGLQQVLVAASLRVSMLARTGDPDLRRRSHEILDLISEGIEISRSLTAELSPPILHEGGLIPALEWLARWMHEKQGLTINLHAEAEADDIPDNLSILLFQAVRELLFNIVKHAGVKTARVHVTQQGDMLVASVSDQGVGFDPQAVQAKPGRAAGFGLFSIRERLDILGGRMEIDSAPGRGSRFTMRVPIGAKQEERAFTPAPETSRVSVAFGPADKLRSAPRIRLMLVDDHLVMREGLRSLFHEEPDMEVIAEASDGENAIRLAREVRPDVILMDVSMPRMSGIEATRKILRDLPATRIIGLSMFDEADRGEAMRKAGAVDYLVKSRPSGELIQAVRDCMSPREN